MVNVELWEGGDGKGGTDGNGRGGGGDGKMEMVQMVMDEMQKTVEIVEIKVHITPWILILCTENQWGPLLHWRHCSHCFLWLHCFHWG